MGRWERHCKHLLTIWVYKIRRELELELPSRNLVSAAPKQWLFEVIDEDGSNGNLKSYLKWLTGRLWNMALGYSEKESNQKQC